MLPGLDLDYASELTGRTPRMIASLSAALTGGKTVDWWIEDRQALLLSEIIKFSIAATTAGRRVNFLAFLNWFMTPQLDYPRPRPGPYSHWRLLSLLDDFTDKGLIYIDVDGRYQPTSLPALRAIMSYWATTDDLLPALASLSVCTSASSFLFMLFRIRVREESSLSAGFSAASCAGPFGSVPLL